MTLLFITEEEAKTLIDMPQAIAAVRDVFQSLAKDEAQNIPRQRVRVPGAMLHSLSASSSTLGYMGWKNYTTTRTAARFHIGLYDQQGLWVALMEADWLGQLRTGAASGVATEILANPDANSVALFGSGKQARTQLQAICEVRPITDVAVYSRTREHREQMAAELNRPGLKVTAADTPAECLVGKDIVITATTANEPVVDGASLQPGMHINAIGSNALNRAELSADCFPHIDQIVCDDLESCRNEAGDFALPLEAGTISWDGMSSLSELLSTGQGSRQNETDITLFKSVGMAIEDIAVAAIVYETALERGLGRKLDIQSPL